MSGTPMHHHHARVTKHEQKMAHPDQVVKDPTRHSDGKLISPALPLAFEAEDTDAEFDCL